MVWNIQKIKNKMFGKIITDKSVQIVTALDKCNIPYFARFNKKEISFVYDCDYIDSVMEILKKAESDGYEDLQRELTNKKNTNGILILLPAVAYHLNMSEGQLKQRPYEIQEALCQTYIDLWFCNKITIQKGLTRLIKPNFSTEIEISQDKNKLEKSSYISRETRQDTIKKLHETHIAEERKRMEREIERSR